MSTALFQSGPASFLRRTSPLDALLAEADRALRVLSGSASAGRPNPATACLLYTSPSPRDQRGSRMPSSA